MTAADRASPGPGARTEDAYEPDPRRWRALVVVLVAGFMVLLDVSIVNVAPAGWCWSSSGCSSSSTGL